MDRLSKFNSFKDHGWLHKSFKKLKENELALAREFIQTNAHLTKGEFELAVNRLFIGKDKPKHWTIIVELLSNSNVI